MEKLEIRHIGMVFAFLLHFGVLVWGASTIASATEKNADALERVADRLAKVESVQQEHDDNLTDLRIKVSVMDALRGLSDAQLDQLKREGAPNSGD